LARPRLFHVSEEPAIAYFEPRRPPSPDSGVEGPAVWAVAESHLPNYLLPRDCPRICFRAGPAATVADRGLLEGSKRVVAFESAWLERVKNCSLTLYELPSATFTEAVPEAGYWISREAVTPVAVRRLDDLLGALTAHADVRLLADFWTLADAVAGSSLEYSIIRKRNAEPRRG
jgi:hypothetical protein